MTKFLLDSSVLISILRGKNGAIDVLSRLDGEILTSAVCLAELYEGVYKSEKIEQNLEKLKHLLLAMDGVISFSDKDAEVFGKLKARLKRTPIPDLDLEIAATCIAQDFTLITWDVRHFPRITGLKIFQNSAGNQRGGLQIVAGTTYPSY